jgi:hypothetical protein
MLMTSPGMRQGKPMQDLIMDDLMAWSTATAMDLNMDVLI